MNKSRFSVLITIIALSAAASFFSPAYGQIDLEEGTGRDRLQLETGTDRAEREREYFWEQMTELEKAIDPADYVLGPYDRIQISIFGTESKSYDLVVLPEGDVFLPGIGTIEADGVTLEDFRRRAASKLREYFHDIEIHCHLLVPRTFKVFVTGEVEEPGAVSVFAVDRVSDAIRKAGDITETGSRRRVRVERRDTVITVDLYRVIMRGDMEENIPLSNGDAIHVPPVDKMVNISGPVRRRGRMEFVPGESIREVITLAGGMTGEAVTDSVLLSRAGEGGEFRTFNVDSGNYDMQVSDMDVINIYDRFSSSDRVFVFGAVNDPGRFYISEGEKLSDLIARVGGFQNEADLKAASVERLDREYLRVDLTRTEELNITLRDGDKIYVPRVRRVVAVGGEVRSPGSFEYQGYLTVAHYVGLAGGPTDQGSMSRIKIYSPDGSVRDADRDTYPIRGDVIIVQKSRTRIIGDFFGGVLNMAAIVVSILVLTR
jgi:protein involved in polysaccharide export with SLBB domain